MTSDGSRFAPPPVGAPRVLYGRATENERIDALLRAARVGEGGALVLRGEAGIGKTALLEATRARHGGTTLAACGSEAEVNLPFAVLHAVLEPALAASDELPDPQRRALRGALAIGPPTSGDRFAVCLATVAMLRAAARDGPTVVLIDDLHWVDRASAECLLFAARRLSGAKVAMLLAFREGEPAPPGLDALPAVPVAPVERGAARAIVGDTGLELAPAACEAVVDAARGNPLALRELPAALTHEERAGRRPLPAPLRLSGRLAGVLQHRIEQLPPSTRAALVVAAAGEGAELAGILSACRALGIDGDAFAPAQDEGLVRIGNGRLAFSHPLVRSAAYHLVARPAERRAAHRALAACASPDRAAWHLAEASAGPDEAVASALQDAARRAMDRRGSAEAAAAYERAASLSVEVGSRARRLLLGSEARISAGQLDRALACIEAAMDAAPELARAARVRHTRAVMLMGVGRIGEALEVLDALACEPEVAAAPALAATVEADAALAEIMGARHRRALERAERAARYLDATSEPLVRARVLTCLAAARAYRGQGASARQIQEEVAPLLDGLDPLAWEVGMRTHSLAILVWIALDEPRRALALSERVLARVAAAGAWAARAHPLSLVARAAFQVGEWDLAAQTAEETASIAAESGNLELQVRGLLTRARVDGARGREAEARGALSRARELLERSQRHMGEAHYHAASGFLELCLGRASAAAQALQPLAAHAGGEVELVPAAAMPWRPDLVEVLVLLGRVEDARVVAAATAEEATRSGSLAARALAARCSGLVADTDFERPFAAALELHAASEAPFERARTLLVFGERLHRARRRGRARRALEEAEEIFTRLAAAPWRDRARAALGAASPRRRSARAEDRDALTAQELRVATIVARGRTVREAAAELLVSPKTVDSHLRQVYAKLGIRSRAELALVAAESGWLESTPSADR